MKVLAKIIYIPENFLKRQIFKLIEILVPMTDGSVILG